MRIVQATQGTRLDSKNDVLVQVKESRKRGQESIDGGKARHTLSLSLLKHGRQDMD